MSIVFDSVVSVAKETKSDEVTLEKAVTDIFEAEPRLYSPLGMNCYNPSYN
jgi:hypothetical protein